MGSSTSTSQPSTSRTGMESSYNTTDTSWSINYFGSLTEPLTLVECPVCGMNFTKDRIEIHAAVCLEAQEVVFVG